MAHGYCRLSLKLWFTRFDWTNRALLLAVDQSFVMRNLPGLKASPNWLYLGFADSSTCTLRLSKVHRIVSMLTARAGIAEIS